MMLTQFKRNPDNKSFHISFDDGIEFDISAKKLRENCPCAGCSGEEVLFYKYTPAAVKLIDDSFNLEKAEIIGNYSIKLKWKDGHDTGLYKWDFLRELCEKTGN